jgi:hypothetical protein
MNSRSLHHDPATISDWIRWLAAGFVFGALAVLTFHQGVLGLLHAIGLAPRAPYSLQATAPFGVPQMWSISAWGGVWGVLLAATLHRLEGARLVLAATLFGLLGPTLVAWFVVAPIKGQAVAGGFAANVMMVGLLVNAAWGLGTGLGLLFLARGHFR